LSAFEVGLKMFTVLRSCSAYAVYKEIYLRCGCTISFDSMTSRLISTLFIDISALVLCVAFGGNSELSNPCWF
jgi:hypothetical protein